MLRCLSESEDKTKEGHGEMQVLTDGPGLLLDVGQKSGQAGVESGIVVVLALLDAAGHGDRVRDGACDETADGEDGEECGLHFDSGLV